MPKRIEFKRQGGPYDVKQKGPNFRTECWFYTNGSSVTVVSRSPGATNSCRIPLRTLKKIVEAMQP